MAAVNLVFVSSAFLISAFLTVVIWRLSRPADRPRRLAMLGLGSFIVLGLAGCGLNPAQAIEEIIAIVSGIIPLATSVIAVFFPGELALLTSAVNLTTSGLKVLQKLVDDYHANPGDSSLAKVQAAFADVQTNLAALEAAARVKDPMTQRKLLAIVNSAVQSLAAIESSLFAKHKAAVAANQAEQGG